jgi:hypothetical protein
VRSHFNGNGRGMAAPSRCAPRLPKMGDSLGWAGAINRSKRDFSETRTRADKLPSIQLTEVSAKLSIYRASIESELPLHRTRSSQSRRTNPKRGDYLPRTICSVNSFNCCDRVSLITKDLHSALHNNSCDCHNSLCDSVNCFWIRVAEC